MSGRSEENVHVFSRFILILFLIFAFCFSAPPDVRGAKAKEKYVVNFVEVDIPSVVKFISGITGKNFIFDERLRGAVTIIAPEKLTADEAFDLFVSVLDLKGYTYVFTGKAYKIIPLAKIKQDPVSVSTDGVRLDEAYIARLIPLENVHAEDMLAVLRPLVSKEAYIAAFGWGKALLMLDTALNIDKVLKIVELIDVETTRHPPEIVMLKHSEAKKIVPILEKSNLWMKPVAGKIGQSKADKEGLKPLADERLNAVVLFGSPEEREELKKLIAILDVPVPVGTSKINVYYLENADASEMAKVLEALTRKTPTSKRDPKASQLTPDFIGRISVTPDASTNSLLILASAEDYQSVVEVIKKLDKRPKQVFVEAMFLEVRVNKALELGAKWRAVAEHDDEPVFIGGLGTIDATAIQGILSGLAGFSMGGLGNFLTVPVTQPDGTSFDLSVPGFAALFSLSEFRDVVEVLSTPQILTSNNKEAEIIVGQNVPFLSQFERSSASADQPVLQSIERHDVGITLRITPQISEGNFVKLDIYQEISAISPATLTGSVEASDIITTKRSAETVVVVKDEQTIVIGGLIENKLTTNITKLPILGDIPLLGWLFKNKSESKEKTNLLLFLTPRIMKDFEELNDLSRERERALKESISGDDGKLKPHEKALRQQGL